MALCALKMVMSIQVSSRMAKLMEKALQNIPTVTNTQAIGPMASLTAQVYINSPTVVSTRANLWMGTVKVKVSCATRIKTFIRGASRKEIRKGKAFIRLQTVVSTLETTRKI